MYSSLQPHGLQHVRLPCPLPTPGAFSNSCPLSWWCHPTISSPSLTSPSPAAFNHSGHQGLFKWVISLHQVPKVLEFQLQQSPSNEYSGLISFRMDWLDLLVVQETQESSPTPQFKSINSSVLSFLYSPALTSYMTTGKTIALTRDTFVRKVMSLLFNTLSSFVVTFLPRSKHLLISRLQWPSAVILEPRKIKSATVFIVSPSIFHDIMGLLI